MVSTEQIQDQTIDYIKQGQDVALKLLTSVSETWAKALRTTVPGASDALPAPHEVIDKTFDFGVQLLDAQRAFAHSLVRATVPAAQATQQATQQAGDRAAERGTDANAAPRSTVRK